MRIAVIVTTVFLAACGDTQDERLDDRARSDTGRAAIEQAARDGRCAELQAPDSHECLRIAPQLRHDTHSGTDRDAQRRSSPTVVPDDGGTARQENDPVQPQEKNDGR